MSHGSRGRRVHTGGVVQVAQHADDLDRATVFYTETLGLPLIARFGPLVFVDLGGTRLLLEEAAPPAMIYLRVDGPRGSGSPALRKAGVEVVAEPHDIFTDTDGVFGGALEVESQAFIRDSEGNLLGLVAPPTADGRRSARCTSQCTVATGRTPTMSGNRVRSGSTTSAPAACRSSALIGPVATPTAIASAARAPAMSPSGPRRRPRHPVPAGRRPCRCSTARRPRRTPRCRAHPDARRRSGRTWR